MAAKPDNSPLIAIVGETASGKTALAIKIAGLFNGEIIAADSRTIYKGMDIASAKPTQEERTQLPHHMIDILTPDQAFSAAQFKAMAQQSIKEIAHEGHLPIMVGGSGLYVDSILFDYDFSVLPVPEERRRLQAMTLKELQDEIKRSGIRMPHNDKNPRHLIRAIETGGTSQKHSALRPRTLVIGLEIDAEVLRQRITDRVDRMFAQGLLEETRKLSVDFGWDAPALQAPGYTVLRELLEGRIDQATAKDLFIRSHYKLAKRQRTWFKRNKSIHWIREQAEAVELVTTFLNK